MDVNEQHMRSMGLDPEGLGKPYEKPRFANSASRYGCESCRREEHGHCVTLAEPGYYPMDSEDAYEPAAFCRCYKADPEMHLKAEQQIEEAVEDDDSIEVFVHQDKPPTPRQRLVRQIEDAFLERRAAYPDTDANHLAEMAVDVFQAFLRDGLLNLD